MWLTPGARAPGARGLPAAGRLWSAASSRWRASCGRTRPSTPRPTSIA